jgi:hypothetical protein
MEPSEIGHRFSGLNKRAHQCIFPASKISLRFWARSLKYLQPHSNWHIGKQSINFWVMARVSNLANSNRLWRWSTAVDGLLDSMANCIKQSSTPKEPRSFHNVWSMCWQLSWHYGQSLEDWMAVALGWIMAYSFHSNLSLVKILRRYRLFKLVWKSR